MVLIDMLIVVDDITILYELIYYRCVEFVYFYTVFLCIFYWGYVYLYLTFLLLNLFTHMYILWFNPQYSKRIIKHNCGICQNYSIN